MHPQLVPLAEYLRQNDWNFAVIDDDSLLLPFSEKELSWTAIAMLNDPAKLLVLHSRLPVHIPPQHRPDIARRLHQFNNGCLAGFFQLDEADGEVLFQTTQFVGADGLDPDILPWFIAAHLVIVGKRFPELMRLALVAPHAPAAPGEIPRTSRPDPNPFTNN
jgi:hypothetical protein